MQTATATVGSPADGRPATAARPWRDASRRYPRLHEALARIARLQRREKRYGANSQFALMVDTNEGPHSWHSAHQRMRVSRWCRVVRTLKRRRSCQQARTTRSRCRSDSSRKISSCVRWEATRKAAAMADPFAGRSGLWRWCGKLASASRSRRPLQPP